MKERNSSTIFQEPIEPTSAELAARFQHAFNVNVQLKKENEELYDRLKSLMNRKLSEMGQLKSEIAALKDDNTELLEKIKTMREVGNNYVSQLEVRVAESQQERDALLIRVGYLERTIEQLKGEKK